MTDIAPIFYNDLVPGPLPYFKNQIYVDTFITASEPEFEEDGERDGNDDLVPTFQKAIYRYRITFPVADYLKRALVLLPMHDVVNIKTKGGDSEGLPRTIRVDTALEANGGLSIVDIVFTEEVSITRKGCSANMV